LPGDGPPGKGHRRLALVPSALISYDFETRTEENRMRSLVIAILLVLPLATLAQTPPREVAFTLVDQQGVGKPIGRVRFEETGWGLLITPDLSGLPHGLHGFHEHSSCAPGEKQGKREPALAAGGHYDPEQTGRHAGPYREDGHRGDLPALYVGPQGRASTPVLAPRLKLGDLAGHAVMIHEGADNYADEPQPLGGGGARIACAVVGAR
jgi:Cu-Zn family superoxide dismutase